VHYERRKFILDDSEMARSAAVEVATPKPATTKDIDRAAVRVREVDPAGQRVQKREAGSGSERPWLARRGRCIGQMDSD